MFPVHTILSTDGSRDDLFQQTLKTLCDTASMLTVVGDGVRKEVPSGVNFVHLDPKKGLGATKNVGAALKQHKTEYICWSDDDMYWLPGWEEAMIKTAQTYPEVGIWGAWGHPFNGPLSLHDKDGILCYFADTCSGNAMFMSKETWYKVMPFPDLVESAMASEDVVVSLRARSLGMECAVAQPLRAIHCGMTNCFGEPATGHEFMRMLADIVMTANGLEGKVLLR